MSSFTGSPRLQSHLEAQQSGSNTFTNAVVDYQKASAVKQATRHEPLSRVLIIYTGGTIGMKALTPGQGYVPVPNWLCETLQGMQRFNDIQFTSQQTAVPISVSVRKSPAFQPIQLPQLITPLSIYGKRICYSILEYDPLLDSSNMGMNDWIQIACDIEANYKDFDAFVILHGTDTMAYTASALSFMLENLGKTVILTGSQVPLAEWRTDAEENLLGSLLMAGHFVIPEVCLYFDNKLYRGNRCTKIDAMDFSAFDSPNLKPLATVGVNIDIDWSEIRRPHAIAKFHVHKILNPNVATLRLFPGITTATVNAFLAPPMQGVVLETYGAGNAPTARIDLLELLDQATERGVVIVNCTQCKRGIVSDGYATGKALKSVGVVPGSDMTPECALAKLSYLIGKENNTPDTVRQLIQTDLRGELTASREEPSVAGPEDPFTPFWQSVLEAFRRYAHATPVKDHQMVIQTLMPHILCLAATHNDADTLESLMSCLSPDQTRITACPEDSTVAMLSYSDADGRTALHFAAISGSFTNTVRLLTLGANVHARDSFGRTPLTYGLIHGFEDIVEILVKAGGFWDQDEELQWAFFRAIEHGNLDKVRLFITQGWDVNQALNGGQTALHLAVVKGYTSLVEYLIEATSIDKNALDEWGMTARDYAQRKGLAAILNLLSQ